jgi:uncharacterized protein YbaR (Trm112 family)
MRWTQCRICQCNLLQVIEKSDGAGGTIRTEENTWVFVDPEAGERVVDLYCPECGLRYRVED